DRAERAISSMVSVRSLQDDMWGTLSGASWPGPCRNGVPSVEEPRRPDPGIGKHPQVVCARGERDRNSRAVQAVLSVNVIVECHLSSIGGEQLQHRVFLQGVSA